MEAALPPPFVVLAGNRAVVNVYGFKILGPALEVKPERVFPVVPGQKGGSVFQPDNLFEGDALEVD